jgi:hypothetical protein
MDVKRQTPKVLELGGIDVEVVLAERLAFGHPAQLNTTE